MEVGASDSVQAVPECIDEYGSNAGLVAGTSVVGTGAAVTLEEPAGTSCQADQADNQ